MKVRLNACGDACGDACGETILMACARRGLVLSAPCGGRQRCGKCRVRLLEGSVAGDAPDGEGWIRACAAVPLADIEIECPVEVMGLTQEQEETAAADPVGRAEAPQRAGIAIDIGTTTVSARLIDLDSASVLDTVSELNDQRAFGADVMSRIGAAQKGKTAELFAAANRQTERIICCFKKRWNIEKIERLAVSGNTVMLHFFLNVDPSSMGEAPFRPAFLEEKIMPGHALGLSAEKITVLPSISAFIGADISAGLALVDMANAPDPSLLIDIGTNGEMALHHGGLILCCATAAGPAFEGAEISCGAGGIQGAISGVELVDDAVSVTTIGNVPPVGVCGSGLIDAVAIMLAQGMIDETGFITAAEKSFNLAPGVSINAADVRQFQLAKSAILTGVRLLCKKAGLKTAEIKNVFIAGGLGFFINKRSAAAAGIFPKDFINALSVCGNLSLQGAAECLTDNNFLEKCKQIISRCTVVNLAADPSFMDEFTQNMLFNEE